ncbi:MAG: preprotein translocase subunit SecG, partial [Deltaproteobacteria bacterium]
MFTTLIVVIHIVVCIALILIILLQTGKGADIGAVFGGGSSHTVFGSTGASSFLSKVTIAAAVTFMLTSIVLSYFSGRTGAVEKTLLQDQSAPLVPGGLEHPALPKPLQTPVKKQAVPSASEKAPTPA